MVLVSKELLLVCSTIKFTFNMEILVKMHSNSTDINSPFHPSISPRITPFFCLEVLIKISKYGIWNTATASNLFLPIPSQSPQSVSWKILTTLFQEAKMDIWNFGILILISSSWILMAISLKLSQSWLHLQGISLFLEGLMEGLESGNKVEIKL